jgi:hypothetical protein
MFMAPLLMQAAALRTVAVTMELVPYSVAMRLRPLFSMLVQELLTHGYEKAADHLTPPLLLLLDEAANIAPIPNLDTIAATAAGQGIQLMSIFHDMTQLRTVHGRARRRLSTTIGQGCWGSGSPIWKRGRACRGWRTRRRLTQRSRSTGDQGTAVGDGG